MKLSTGEDTVKTHCDRVDYIHIHLPAGRTERLEHGTSYGLCVESERLGIPLKDLIRERIAPDLVDVKIVYWY